MKTAELSGAALDWAVAKCEFSGCEGWDETLSGVDAVSDMEGKVFSPSTDWAQGGAIIERERICLIDQGGDYWQAQCGWKEAFGDTPLIAAMRCYVASKLGDEVELPEELLSCAHD